jgi:type II secretory ATPase GspE/PulE/Tfp pilus assembly ATPase PilB-like protein
VICPECRTPATPEEAGLGRLGDAARLVSRLWRGAGCPACNGTGYRGRLGVFEILTITPPLADLISRGADLEALRRQARTDGLETMARAGLQKLEDGVTTVDEVVRVLSAVE